MIWIFPLALIAIVVITGLVINLSGKKLSRRHPPPYKDRITRRKSYAFIAVLMIAVLGCFGMYHWQQLSQQIWTMPIVIFAFIFFVITIIAAHFNKTYKDSPKEALRTTLVIPVYNEAPETLERVLDSITSQTQLPNTVHIINDGSIDHGKCKTVYTRWRRKAKKLGVACNYKHTKNAGKRHAQSIAFLRHKNNTDIFITIDSDTVLDCNAIKEGLKPFSDKRVMSVAGLLVGLNRRKFLSRVLNIGFVSSFTNGRAAWSALKSVAVSCGGLAFYRSVVVDEHLDDYLDQRVLGKPARFGDDRMLTQFASLHGRTVFQESAAGYTLLPENFNHLTRQRARWWRSFWWGGLWVLRHQSTQSGVWWLVLSQYICTALYAVLFPAVIIVYPIMNQHFPWEALVYIILLSYVRSIRTLRVRRPDIRWRVQLAEYVFLSPLSSLLYIYVATILQFWALITLNHGSWGTRAQVEVAVEDNHK